MFPSLIRKPVDTQMPFEWAVFVLKLHKEQAYSESSESLKKKVYWYSGYKGKVSLMEFPTQLLYQE